MRGRRGRLVVAKVGYAGFEPVDRLIVLAATESELLDPAVALEILSLPIETKNSSVATIVSDDRIEDAVDEAVFLDQEEVEAGERTRFEAARSRLERSVEDRLLILRRRLAEVESRTISATADRDRALSVEARESAERLLKKLEAEGGELETALVDLEQRTEEAYRTRRDALTLRRTAAPSVDRIIDVGFELS
jgi:exonuclease VII small subunit